MPINTIDRQSRTKQLDHYDFSMSGAYYITIASLERKPIFGEIQKEMVVLNKVGDIALKEWERLTKRFFYIELGAFVVMPDHIHGIIAITGKEPGKTALQKRKLFPSHLPKSKSIGASDITGSIATVLRFYKSSVSLRCRPILGKGNKTVWQGGYSEHIIQDAADMESITSSIDANPSNWEQDIQAGNPDY